MGITHDAGAAVGRALKNVHAGLEKLASRKLTPEIAPSLRVTSDELVSGSRLPLSATVDGEGKPPSLRWSAVPAGTRSIAVVVEDPDAPFPEPFVHWLVYGLPASVSALTGAAGSGKEGKNSKLATGFTPAAPPPGHGLHRYHFQVFALDTEIDLAAGAGRGELFDRMRGHILGWGEVLGTYERA